MTAEISRANDKQHDRRQGQLASFAGGAQRNGGERNQKKPKRTMKPTNFAEQNARRKQQEKQDQSYSNEASWKKKINKVGGRLNFQGRGRRDTQHMRGNRKNKTKQKQHSDPDYNPPGSKKRKKQDDEIICLSSDPEDEEDSDVTKANSGDEKASSSSSSSSSNSSSSDNSSGSRRQKRKARVAAAVAAAKKPKTGAIDLTT